MILAISFHASSEVSINLNRSLGVRFSFLCSIDTKGIFYMFIFIKILTETPMSSKHLCKVIVQLSMCSFYPLTQFGNQFINPAAFCCAVPKHLPFFHTFIMNCFDLICMPTLCKSFSNLSRSMLIGKFPASTLAAQPDTVI